MNCHSLFNDSSFFLNVSTVISVLLIYNTANFIYCEFSFKNYYRKFLAFIN